MTAPSNDLRQQVGRELELRKLYAVDAECIGDASTDFSPPFDPSLGDCLSQIVRWRRARHLAGRPSALFDFMEAFDTCSCDWTSRMCERHHDWIKRRHEEKSRAGRNQ